MSFTEAIKSVFSKYATFSGRARRSEYWNFILLNLIVTTVLSVLSTIFGGSESIIGMVFSGISGIWSLAILIPNLAVIWRRLHDIGKSGATFFFVLIPLVGAIMLIVWFCQDSQPGENQYGPNPKEATVR